MSTQLELFEAFESALADLDGLYDKKEKPAQDALNAEYTAALEAEFKKRHPRKRFSFSRPELREEGFKLDEIKAPFVARALAITKALTEERDALTKKLDDLAAQIEITPALKIVDKSQWSLYSGHSSGTYSTQGFGACKYAQGAAESSADHVRACGVEAEVQRVDREAAIASGWRIEHADFNVYAGCSPVVCAVVHRKPGVSLRDWLKASWKRGVNPRVANPFLPAGLEDKLGIDYFGNDKKAVTA